MRIGRHNSLIKSIDLVAQKIIGFFEILLVFFANITKNILQIEKNFNFEIR